MAIKFEERIASAKTKQELSQLANDILTDSDDFHLLPERMTKLLDAGLDPNEEIDGCVCVFDLIYGATNYHLKAAKIIFERFGVPNRKIDDDTFFSWLQSKVDYSDYNSPYVVKLFLLCSAYLESVEGLKMVTHLYPEMFSEEGYRSALDVSQNSVPLKLTKDIFKDIDKFDWCIEMEEQKRGCYGCWRMHIFDKKSKIEVATYPY